MLSCGAVSQRRERSEWEESKKRRQFSGRGGLSSGIEGTQLISGTTRIPHVLFCVELERPAERCPRSKIGRARRAPFLRRKRSGAFCFQIGASAVSVPSVARKLLCSCLQVYSLPRSLAEGERFGEPWLRVVNPSFKIYTNFSFWE